MAKLTVEDLKRIKKETNEKTALRPDGAKVKITVHMGTCGLAAGAGAVMDALNEELAASNRKDIRVVGSGCMGMCSSEPNVTIEMMNEETIIYKHMDANRMRQVFRRHVLLGEVQSNFAQTRM